MASPTRRIVGAKPLAPLAPPGTAPVPVIPGVTLPLVSDEPIPVPVEVPTVDPAVPVVPEVGGIDPTPEPLQLPDDFHDLVGAAVDATNMSPAETAIFSMVMQLQVMVGTLVDAVGQIGEQQQWVTDAIVQTKQQFDGMMAGGNPLKMLGQMMRGGK